MAHLCDVCAARPTTVRLAVLRNGRRHVIDVCDFHYAQLTRHQRALSPLESLFMGGAPEQAAAPETPAPPESGAGVRRNEAEGANIDRYFSDGAKEMLMRAAERAVQSGCPQVDTEHLLYVLANNAVTESVLRSIGIDPAEIRAYIDANAQRREGSPLPQDGMIAVSPRLKSALDRAFLASRQLRHSYVAPEHLLIGLADVPDSFAGQLLGKLGVDPQALRQQTAQTVGAGAPPRDDGPPSRTPNLDKFSRDLTALAREGRAAWSISATR